MYRDGENFCLYRFLVCYMKRSLVINLSGPARSGTFFLGPSSWSECLTRCGGPKSMVLCTQVFSCNGTFKFVYHMHFGDTSTLRFGTLKDEDFVTITVLV